MKYHAQMEDCPIYRANGMPSICHIFLRNYLTDVLPKLGNWLRSKVAQLAPDRWATAREKSLLHITLRSVAFPCVLGGTDR